MLHCKKEGKHIEDMSVLLQHRVPRAYFILVLVRMRRLACLFPVCSHHLFSGFYLFGVVIVLWSLAQVICKYYRVF